MSKPPFDKPSNGLFHFAKRCMKAFSNFRPTHPLRLVRKKWTMLKRGSFFAVTPWNLFGEDAVLFARTSAHSGCDIFANEEYGNVPKRNEVEAAGMPTCIVGGTSLTAFRADGMTIFTRNDFDVDVLKFGSCFM